MTEDRFEELTQDIQFRAEEGAILRRALGLPFDANLIEQDEIQEIRSLVRAANKLYSRRASHSSTAEVDEEACVPDHGNGLWDEVNSFPGPPGPQDSKE